MALDLEQLMADVVAANTVNYRDPFEAPYGDPEKTTRTQSLARQFFLERGDGLFVYDDMEKKEVLRPPMVVMLGAKGSGKMLANSEPVLTPNGFVRNDSLRVGDSVIGSNGKATTVLGVYPQGKQRIVRVEMSDGTFVRASWDHLWAVQTGSQRRRGSDPVVKTTREIADDLTTRQGHSKWYLPELSPVVYASQPRLPLAPYSVGALLGDGGLTGSTPVITSEDPEILERVASETGMNLVYSGQYDYRLTNARGNGTNPLTATLRDLGMMGVGAKNKSIPSAYLTASVEDRIDLMRGLMDTDGGVTYAGTAEFYTSSPQLAEDFVTLCRSLGLVTKNQTKLPPPNTNYGISYRVRVNAPFNPFYLDRKASQFNVNATQGRVKAIARIYEDGDEEATCIAVEAEDHLYVTRDFNVTHNTRFGAKFAMHQVQMFPGSTGCIISNTYVQATRNAGPQLVDEARKLGYNIEFFREKKIKGQKIDSFYAIDLDGKGFDDGIVSYVIVASFEAVGKLEGVELDYLWVEEIQDTDWESFNIVYTRVRGKGANRHIFVAGMPFDDTHWMYSRLPELGATPENEIRASMNIDAFDARYFADRGEEIPMETIPLAKSKSIGVMFEPTIFENKKNLPPGEIARLAASLDGLTFERWIYGKRTSMTTDRIAYAFDVDTHARGRASRILSQYDPQAELILSIDFNTRPMCATVWQKKKWDDAWLDPSIVIDPQPDGTLVWSKDGEPYRPLTWNTREVLVQIAEIERWRGDTLGLMEDFVETYKDHDGGVTILGDATGNRDDTRSGTTDWEIIATQAAKLRGVTVVKGLQFKSDFRSGKVTYSNPPRRDTFNVLNAALRDGEQRSWVYFMPKSDLPSGGAVASLMSAKKRPDGYMDESNDKKEDERLPRTHFFDTIRYVVWWFRGGLTSRAGFEESVKRMAREARFSESVGDSWIGSDSGSVGSLFAG